MAQRARRSEGVGPGHFLCYAAPSGCGEEGPTPIGGSVPKTMAVCQLMGFPVEDRQEVSGVAVMLCWDPQLSMGARRRRVGERRRHSSSRTVSFGGKRVWARSRAEGAVQAAFPLSEPQRHLSHAWCVQKKTRFCTKKNPICTNSS